jgi:hypothetical protein
MPIHLGHEPHSRSSFSGMSAPSYPSHRYCDRYGILTELGAADRQNPGLQIDVLKLEIACFAEA